METLQENITIIAELKQLLKPYEEQLSVKENLPEKYELACPEKIKIGKSEREVYFTSIILQKNHIGLYFMPVYTHPKEFTNLDPELKKMLKGKSCFHIKSWNDDLKQKLQDLFDDGFSVYKKAKWV